MMKTISLTYLLLLFLFATVKPSITYAAQTTDIIKQVITAYGGKTLTHAKSIKIVDYNKGPWPGESENPDVPEIWRINEELTIDFETQRKSLLSYRVPRTTLDLEKWIFDGKQGINYDIFHQKYAIEDWVTFKNLGGSIERSSDTIHAKNLHNKLKHATYMGDEYYRGKAHYKLNVELNSGAQFTYIIDKATGLIKKALRSVRHNQLVYAFSNHTHRDQVAFARDMNFFVNGELRLTSLQKSIEINPDLTAAFEKPHHFQAWGAQLDNNKMQAKQLAEQIYQAGKGRNKTIFFEQADHYIAVGGASALEENLSAVTTLTKRPKPIRYFIITHHHRRNLQGLDKPLKLGAKLVTAKAHLKTINEAVAQHDKSNHILIVPDRKPFKLGNITLFDIPTAHSKHYLMVYVKNHKMVIAEEHYETHLKTAKPRIYKDMVIFANALKQLNIKVEALVDIQSWRVLDIEEFTQWVNTFELPHCPVGYTICNNG